MRYPELTDEQRRRVLDYARSQVAVAGFAKLQLALLAPYALARSYSRVLPGSARAVAEQEAAQPLHRAAELAAVAASCRDSARRARRRGNAAARMFCSELVFRAYEAAFAPIEIIDPLYDRRSRRRRSLAPGTGSARGRDVRYGQPETESAFAERGAVSDWAEPAEIRSVLDAYDDFVELDVLSDPDLAPSRTPGGSADLGAAEGGLAGPRDPGPGGPLTPARRLEFADMITPGDYWSSPSLDPVAALHRTPDRRR
jgi:hypothetical protein